MQKNDQKREWKMLPTLKNESFVVNLSLQVRTPSSYLKKKKKNPNKTISSKVFMVLSRGIDFVFPNKAPL